MPTYILSHWARDRSRGEKLPLEFAVKLQTSETARLYGLNDRGVLAEGKKADINLIDFANLRVRAPEMVYDLPAGGWGALAAAARPIARTRRVSSGSTTPSSHKRAVE